MSFTTVLERKEQTDAIHLQNQEDLEKARKQIKSALQMTMFMGGLNAFIWLAALNNPKIPGGGWIILDVIFIFAMGYGLYRKNPLCAKLMLGYFVLSKITLLFVGQLSPVAIPFAGVIFYYLWQGVVGTKNYRELIQLVYMGDQFIPQQETEEETVPERSAAPQMAKNSQPLIPNPELMSLCGGDFGQAQWLLSKVKRQNPDQSVEWCNEQVIAQLTHPTGTSEA